MESLRIKMGIQKRGRLSKESFDLLESCGLTLSQSKDQLFCRSQEMPIDVLLLRDDDIPYLIEQGECDLGIVGRNLVAELRERDSNPLFVHEIMSLGFSRCQMCLAGPKESGIQRVQDLSNKKIATSYPALLRTFLNKHKVSAHIVRLGGAVEVAPRLGMADAIFDLVSSGATLAANHLEKITTVLESEALLVQPKDNFSPAKQKIVTRLVNRIQGVVQARSSKYIMLNAPKKAVRAITQLIPGCDQPTLMPLPEGDMVAFHAVCRETVFWDTMEEIKKAGARSILVIPIEKMLK